MSLRAKIYLIVGATLLVAVAVVFMVSQTVFMRGFASVENTEAQDQIKRAQAAVTWNVMELGIAVKSYRSEDDDPRTSCSPKIPPYVDSELSESFFAGVKANAAGSPGRERAICSGAAGSTSAKSEFTALPSGLESYLAPQGGLTQRFLAGQDISGILMLSGAPMLVNSQPHRSRPGARPSRAPSS